MCAHHCVKTYDDQRPIQNRPNKIPRSEFFFSHKTNLCYLHQTWKTKRSYPNKYLGRGEFCWWTTELWTRWAIPGWVFESAWWKSWRATGNTMICRISLHNDKPEYQDLGVLVISKQWALRQVIMIYKKNTWKLALFLPIKITKQFVEQELVRHFCNILVPRAQWN